MTEESETEGVQWRDVKYVAQAVLIAIIIEMVAPYVDIVQRAFDDAQLTSTGKRLQLWREYLLDRLAQ